MGKDTGYRRSKKRNGKKETRRLRLPKAFMAGVAVVMVCLVLLQPASRQAGSREESSFWDVYDFSAPVLRVHVVSHDDSAPEEELKNEVRREIQTLVYSSHGGANGYGELLEKVSRDLPRLERQAKNMVRDRGFSHGIEVNLDEREFPLRHYGEQVYPPGKYLALQVVIGKGRGSNWWCLLYPSLCTPPAETGEKGENAGAKDGKEDAADKPAPDSADSGSEDSAAGSVGEEDGDGWKGWTLALWEWLSSLFS